MLKTLHTVEFTLDERLPEKQVRSICCCHAAPVSPGEFLNLRNLYVEVAGSERMDVIIALMSLSVNVSDLHVHFLRGNFAEAVAKCKKLWDSREHLRAFTFTSEEPSTALPLLTSPQAGWNGFMMNELAMRREPLQPGRQTVVVLPWCLTAVQMMRGKPA
ncbi:hypothetical protein MTO96_051231 [Rhipicephalus appendiculatus]